MLICCRQKSALLDTYASLQIYHTTDITHHKTKKYFFRGKVKFSLWLIKHYAMKAYGWVDV
jgi:hypothetical protein